MAGDMKIHSFLCGIVFFASILMTGCQPSTVGIEHEAVRLAVRDEAEMDALWDTTLEVLRRYRFHVDRRDRTSGVITTLPENSGHWFEFWRQDTVTPYSAVESSVQTINRDVTINISPSNRPDARVLSLKVAKTQLSAPERQVTNAVAARRIFSQMTPVQSGDVPSREATTEWIPLGRDPHLEQRMLARIVALYVPASYEFIPEPAEPSVHPVATTQATTQATP